MGVSASVEHCTTIKACSSADAGREKISIATQPGELREKTYVTSRADTDTAIPVSVRSQVSTDRSTPREDWPCVDEVAPRLKGWASRQAEKNAGNKLIFQAVPRLETVTDAGEADEQSTSATTTGGDTSPVTDVSSLTVLPASAVPSEAGGASAAPIAAEATAAVALQNGAVPPASLCLARTIEPRFLLPLELGPLLEMSAEERETMRVQQEEPQEQQEPEGQEAREPEQLEQHQAQPQPDLQSPPQDDVSHKPTSNVSAAPTGKALSPAAATSEALVARSHLPYGDARSTEAGGAESVPEIAASTPAPPVAAASIAESAVAVAAGAAEPSQFAAVPAGAETPTLETSAAQVVVDAIANTTPTSLEGVRPSQTHKTTENASMPLEPAVAVAATAPAPASTLLPASALPPLILMSERGAPPPG
mmetsp:Transcript_54511/g.151979  ORF Transcript_54511/g.151979 Transcript_54511/m.151979 type:complete len:422 (+) Transcript_54511:236-1501(+)